MSEKRFSMAGAVISGWNMMLAYVRRTPAGEEKSPAESPVAGGGIGPDELRQEIPEATQEQVPEEPAQETREAGGRGGETPDELPKKSPEKGRLTCAKGVMYINLEG